MTLPFAKKSLGQHFLTDTNMLSRIVRAAGSLDGVHVIEIGPGPAGLTRAIMDAKPASLHAVEKDRRFIEPLQAMGVMVSEADALKLDVTTLAPAPRKIIANLPYNVGTELLLMWLDAIYQDPAAFAKMTLMFQKEVVERIVAVPGSKAYGRLAVIAQWLCTVQKEFDVPAGAFSPPPKVTSAIVSLVPRAQPLVAVGKKALEQVTAAAFGQRRKMLRGSLKSLVGDQAEALLAKAGIDATLRVEQLDVPTIGRLAQAYEAGF